MIFIKRYLFNLLIALDQGVNTIFAGDPDETISSRMGKGLRKKDCKLCFMICMLLNLFEKEHCIKSIEADEGKDDLLK